MNNLVNFLRDYWQYISICIVVLLDIVILIIKRRPKKYDEFVEIIGRAMIKVPHFVAEAEGLGEGMEKKQYVLSWLSQFVENALHRDMTDNEFDYFYKSLSWMIEETLSCPTKKGGPGREEDE